MLSRPDNFAQIFADLNHYMSKTLTQSPRKFAERKEYFYLLEEEQDKCLFDLRPYEYNYLTWHSFVDHKLSTTADRFKGRKAEFSGILSRLSELFQIDANAEDDYSNLYNDFSNGFKKFAQQKKVAFKGALLAIKTEIESYKGTIAGEIIDVNESSKETLVDEIKKHGLFQVIGKKIDRINLNVSKKKSSIADNLIGRINSLDADFIKYSVDFTSVRQFAEAIIGFNNKHLKALEGKLATPNRLGKHITDIMDLIAQHYPLSLASAKDVMAKEKEEEKEVKEEKEEKISPRSSL